MKAEWLTLLVIVSITITVTSDQCPGWFYGSGNPPLFPNPTQVITDVIPLPNEASFLIIMNNLPNTLTMNQAISLGDIQPTQKDLRPADWICSSGSRCYFDRSKLICPVGESRYLNPAFQCIQSEYLGCPTHNCTIKLSVNDLENDKYVLKFPISGGTKYVINYRMWFGTPSHHPDQMHEYWASDSQSFIYTFTVSFRSDMMINGTATTIEESLHDSLSPETNKAMITYKVATNTSDIIFGLESKNLTPYGLFKISEFVTPNYTEATFVTSTSIPINTKVLLDLELEGRLCQGPVVIGDHQWDCKHNAIVQVHHKSEFFHNGKAGNGTLDSAGRMEWTANPSDFSTASREGYIPLAGNVWVHWVPSQLTHEGFVFNPKNPPFFKMFVDDDDWRDNPHSELPLVRNRDYVMYYGDNWKDVPSFVDQRVRDAGPLQILIEIYKLDNFGNNAKHSAQVQLYYSIIPKKQDFAAVNNDTDIEAVHVVIATYRRPITVESNWKGWQIAIITVLPSVALLLSMIATVYIVKQKCLKRPENDDEEAGLLA